MGTLMTLVSCKSKPRSKPAYAVITIITPLHRDFPIAPLSAMGHTEWKLTRVQRTDNSLVWTYRPPAGERAHG